MVESHRQEIAKLEALYASNPAGRVFVHLAEALRRAGEHERARSILEEGLARHPDSASGYVVLGRVLIDRAETDGAESAFRKALELDRGNLIALRSLGDLARGGGRPAEALTHYRELIARNPASAVDSGLMRLLDEAERNVAEAAVAAAEAQEAEQAAAAAEQGAPAAGEEAEVAAGHEPSDSVAPGRAGPATPAEPEYGIVELEALPGDLASFAGLTSRETAGAADEPEPEPRGLEDDVVVLLESSAAPLELEELETELAASPAEVNLLSALPEPEYPPASEPPLTIPDWAAETPFPAGEPEETAATTPAAGDMDVAAAMLNVSELSAATPFEVVPEATELTLVDDDSVRVAMARSETSVESADADAASLATDQVGAAAEVAGDEQFEAAEVAGDEQVGVAADVLAGEDARTRHPVDEADAEAAATTEEYEDLPWLVEPAEAAGAAFAGTGAGEDTAPAEPAAGREPFAEEIRAEGELGPAVDLEPGAAGDGALDLSAPVGEVFEAGVAELAPAVEDAYAVPFDIVDDTPVDLTGEFEAPAERFAPEAEAPRESALDAGEHEVEATDVAAFGERPDELRDVAPFDEAVEAAPDRWPPREPAPEFAPFEEPVEATPEAAPEFVTFAEPDATPDFAVVDERAETAADLAAFAEEVEAVPAVDLGPDAEPGRARFAEDVEAEPDLATFMESIEADREAVPFATDLDFAGYEERAGGETDLGEFLEEVEAEPHLTEYIEDVEAEPELAGFGEAAEAEPHLAAFVESAEPELAEYDEQAEAQRHRDWLDDDLDAIEPADAGARAAGAPAIDETVTAGDVSWLEEIATTGGPEPDFSPPPGMGRSADAAGAAHHAAGAGRADAIAAGAGAGDLGTETLADLYLAQGFAQRAAEVYRALLSQRPADERLTAKLRDAEAALAASRGAEGEEAGDVWLRGVESAWTGGAGATGQETTPYAWTEREEHEQGIGIGAYLRDLISWGTGDPARLDETVTGPAPGPGGEPMSAAQPAEEARSGTAEAEPEIHREPESWGGPLDETAGEVEERPAEAESEPASSGPWGVGAEPVLEETWTATEPAEAWSAPVEPPLDPWLAPEPTAVRAGPPEPAPRGPAANPVEEAFNEWFGPPPDAARPAASESQSRRQPGTEAGPGETTEASTAEDDEDEDLEMFRAWLQSLKK